MSLLSLIPDNLVDSVDQKYNRTSLTMRVQFIESNPELVYGIMDTIREVLKQVMYNGNIKSYEVTLIGNLFITINL